MAASLKARLIRELRRSPLPCGTGALALLCAADYRRAAAVTLTELLKLERLGVVERAGKQKGGGRGRPAWRWVLRRAAG